MVDVARSIAVALALFLVAGTVISELASPLFAGEVVESAGPSAPPRADVLLTVTVHHVERRMVNETGEETCMTIRTLSDTVAPVLLLDQTKTDACTPYEEVDVRGVVDSKAPGQLTRYDVAFCMAPTFSTTGRAAGGTMLTSAEAEPCTRPPAVTFRGFEGPGFLNVMAYPHEIAEPGLVIACVAVEIEFDDGTRGVFQDMAWFETWASLEEYPGRTAVRESRDGNVSCRQQGVEWRPQMRSFPEQHVKEHFVVRSGSGP